MADTYTLPDSPYDAGALEPHISGRIMELHHAKHHAAYVKGANTALEQLAEARGELDFGAVSMLQKNLAFNVSGHVLHSLFWTNLSPDGGGEPTGPWHPSGEHPSGDQGIDRTSAASGGTRRGRPACRAAGGRHRAARWGGGTRTP